MYTSSPIEGLGREGKRDSFLHSIRKPPPKPWKKSLAGPPPTRVYFVDPHGFRQLVQKLTGAPQLPLQQHRNLQPPPPPPPLNTTTTSPLQPQQLGYSQEIEGSSISSQPQLFLASETKKGNENLMPGTTQFRFTSAPPYSSWSSYPPLSPGAVPLLEQYSTAL